MFNLIILSTLLSSTVISALPLSSRQTTQDSTTPFLTSTSTKCPISNNNLLLPLDQTNLTFAEGSNPVFVTIARGIQNYTCSETGKWKPTGAIAHLFDISCSTPETYNSIESSQITHDTPFDLELDYNSIPTYLGLHTFVLSAETNSIQPKFDFSTVLVDENQFIIGNKTGSLPSPNDPSNDVAWLQLNNVEGSLATIVYRIYTVGGNPPTSCATVSSATLSIPYAAQYWFFK